ncbi:MAG: CRISPR-associated endoribonuclease Cas6, partial [Archaeoglobales archaeon]
MRLRIEFDVVGNVIDINYNYQVASFIYRCIERANPSLSLDLHKPSIFKFFTFSRIDIPNKRFEIVGDKLVIKSDKVNLYFSTPKVEIAESFVEGLLRKPEVKVGGAEFVVSSVKVLREHEICDKVRFATLSPISVTTLRDGRQYDLYPKDAKFYENLRMNLIKKFVVLHGRYPECDDIKVRPLKVKPKRIKVKNTHHRCVEMVFDAEGSKELLELGYKAGFGERNSMGFGMVKVV